MSKSNLSARIRSVIERLGQGTAAEIRAALDPADHAQMAKRLFHLCRDGHVVRSGDPRSYVYRLGRTPRAYSNSPEERAALREKRRVQANARARAKYAAERGGKVRERAVPDPRHINRPKPTSAQQIAITPARHPTRVIPPKRRQPMTSQEWEAQGGVVERLPNGAVSKASTLRFIHTP
ncbi:MAG TPA: hypothetical protein VIG97_03375 [Luteimonas sp.]